ncbi:MAG: carbamoyltransferase [SAR324 cluster bacterium]|nr:carbamoyltransferase [SAR324 cluster bacterium]
MMRILGISAYYHDSAACLIEDGQIIAAAQEERFTRVKQDPGFPHNAILYCLSEAGTKEVDYVVFYEKPITKFSRLFKTYVANAPFGKNSFLASMPVWLKDKLYLPVDIKRNLKKCGLAKGFELCFTEHHQSHGASAFFPSPFEDAAVVTLDGVGEWTSSSISHGSKNKLTPMSEMYFPHSLGLLYSAVTYFTGFKVNSGEYKLMGLAPYGNPTYVEKIKKNLITIFPDGSFQLDLKYFSYLTDLKMTSDAFSELFDGPPREPESPITRREMDLAKSIQVVTEEIVEKICRHALALTGSKNLCLAGGVALNCVSNGHLIKNVTKNIWIQPASGDAGGALGAAMHLYYHNFKNPRIVKSSDSMVGSYLGPDFSDKTEHYLKEAGLPYKSFEKQEDLYKQVGKLINEQNVIGVSQGRMEYGPRSLGNRSILGDPRSEKMQSVMNLKIKYRESFRPFAPSCLEEDVKEYFEIETNSPYMLLVAPVQKDRCIPTDHKNEGDLISMVNQKRSDIPAITHVDYSARVQTVTQERNKAFYNIISEFKKLSGFGVVINTSFNVRGEPIVCTPEDAYRCFMRTEMDYLLLDNFLLYKKDQPKWDEESNWQEEFVLD